jgi:hypothetical protein
MRQIVQLIEKCINALSIKKAINDRLEDWRSCASYKKSAITAPSATPKTAAMVQSINAWIS